MTDIYNIYIIVKLNEIEKKYTCNSNMSFKDLKLQIVNDIFTTNNKYTTFKYLEFDNISSKIYRNFGKICLLNGLISNVFDNRLLNEFFNEEQEVTFEILPIEEEETPFNTLSIKKSKSLNKSSNKLSDIMNNPGNLENQRKERIQEFVFNEKDFPPLS
jgi:hypothetical protein